MNLATVLEAASFAAGKHRDQRRKDEEASPYINHPLAVANVLASEAGVTDHTLLAAALLHDTIEDTETTFEELEERFGSEVRGLVAEVSDDKSLPKAARKELQVTSAPTMSDAAKKLEIADKICNVRDIAKGPPAGWSRERQADYVEFAVWVVAGCRGINAKLDRAFDEAAADARRRLRVT